MAEPQGGSARKAGEATGGAGSHAAACEASEARGAGVARGDDERSAKAAGARERLKARPFDLFERKNGKMSFKKAMHCSGVLFFHTQYHHHIPFYILRV